MTKNFNECTVAELIGLLPERVNRVTPAQGKVLGAWVHRFSNSEDETVGESRPIALKVEGYPDPWYNKVVATNGTEKVPVSKTTHGVRTTPPVTA